MHFSYLCIFAQKAQEKVKMPPCKGVMNHLLAKSWDAHWGCNRNRDAAFECITYCMSSKSCQIHSSVLFVACKDLKVPLPANWHFSTSPHLVWAFILSLCPVFTCKSPYSKWSKGFSPKYLPCHSPLPPCLMFLFIVLAAAAVASFHSVGLAAFTVLACRQSLTYNHPFTNRSNLQQHRKKGLTTNPHAVTASPTVRWSKFSRLATSV